jgi:hypothetical protein
VVNILYKDCSSLRATNYSTKIIMVAKFKLERSPPLGPLRALLRRDFSRDWKANLRTRRIERVLLSGAPCTNVYRWYTYPPEKVYKSLTGEYKPSPDEGRAFWTVDVVGKSLGWRGNNHFLLPTRATSITDDSDLEFSVVTEYLCAALDHGDENIIFPVAFPEKYHGGGAAHMLLFVANVRSMEVRLLDLNPPDAANPLQYLEVVGFIGQELTKRLNGNPTFTSFRDNSCPRQSSGHSECVLLAAGKYFNFNKN